MTAAWRVEAPLLGWNCSGGDEPRALTLDLDVMRISLHRWNGLLSDRYGGPDGWFVSCQALNIRRWKLSATTLDGLKAEAIATVASHVADLQRAIDGVSS